jgi:hypothetical protein
MKLVKLLSLNEGAEKITSKEILTLVVKAMPEGGDVEEITKRARVLKAIKAASDTNLVLEDADHEKLVACVKGFKFGAATLELAEILGEVLNAKEAPAVMQAAE